MRTGLIAKKLGMSRIFNAQGQHVPVTVLHVDNVQVTATRTADKNGYTAVQLGLGQVKPSRVSKPRLGQFAQAKVEPKAHVAEFRVDADQILELGAALQASHFTAGQFVDVTAVTIGKGFQGVMKRHKFRGLEASHGVSISHRSHGSTGQRQDPGKVFKGKKMAGHMGARQRTQQNLQVVAVDADKGLLLLKGSVPGAKGTVVAVRDAVKKPAKQ